MDKYERNPNELGGEARLGAGSETAQGKGQFAWQMEAAAAGFHEAQEALFASRTTLREVIDNIPQRVFWKDRNCVFLGCNRAFAQDMGFSEPDELIGKTDFDVCSNANGDHYRADDMAVMESGVPKADIEEQQVRADGRTVWLKTCKVPLRGRQNEVVGVLGTYEDVTERKRLEAERDLNAQLVKANADLLLAKEEADSASRAKSEFLSRMSHELRTPLNAILGFGQILNRPGLTALQQECVHYILRGGRHLLDLINEVLDLARVEAGHIELSVEPILLSDVVPEACALVRPLAAERGIRIAEIGPEPSAPHVLADRQRLKQVLLNLLSNAVKYNVSGGLVEVSYSERADGRTRIAVRDTGHGIPASELPKLFTPFERLGAANSDVEGTGLGLVLSQRLIAAMGGTLDVESAIGQGTTFYVDLPRAAAPEEALTRLTLSTEPDGALQTGGRELTVLCIEDNLSNLRLMEVILKGRPEVTLLAAMQGSVGLDLAIQHRPDLILLDLNLPDLSGKDVLARLLQNPATAHIPVVVISADATRPQVDRLLAAGARAYLTKPLDIPEFLRVLNEAIRAADTANARPAWQALAI